MKAVITNVNSVYFYKNQLHSKQNITKKCEPHISYFHMLYTLATVQELKF